jgi:hypothetical protein
MPFGFRKSIGLSRFLRLNLSKAGASVSGRLGPFSTNSRTRRLRVELPFGLWYRQK